MTEQTSERTRLPEGKYFGAAIRQVTVNGMTLTLSRYSEGEAQPWHTHENPTLFFLMRGGLRDRRRRNELELQTQMLVYHPVDEPHRSEPGPRGMVGLNIEPSSAWLSSHQLSAKDLGAYTALPCPTLHLTGLRMLLQLCSSSAPFGADLENDAFEMVLPLVSRNVDRTNSRSLRWLRRVEAFLRESLTETVSLRDAAREANVHPVHLARVFRAHYGCSVGEYVRGLRLLHAADHALGHHGRLCDAAHEAGFADQAHFTRLFVRELRVRPKALLRLRAAL
jgi:AraC-like DNA-binding protein